MPLINQPSNQIKYALGTLYKSPILNPACRLTNVSIVRLKKGGKRFEARQLFHHVLVAEVYAFQDCLLQEQGPGMEKRRVSKRATTCLSTKRAPISETDLDDVLQINNVFTNVSKGEVAKHDDLRKAFGKMDADDIVKEVCDSTAYIYIAN